MTTFKWTIENVGLSPMLPGEFLQSPMFYVEESETFKCCLKLFPKGFHSNVSNTAALLLWRCDEYSRTIRLDYKLTDTHCSKAYHHEFGNLQILNMKCKERSLLLPGCILERNLLNVICEILKCEDVYKDGDKQDLEDLSCVYESLLETGSYSDVNLQIGGKNFDLHKSILKVRCSALAEELEKPEKLETYDHPGTATIFQNLFHFLYSGKYDSQIIPVELCILLEKLDGSILKRLSSFHTDLVAAKTLVYVKSTSFTLPIEYFGGFPANEKICYTLTEGSPSSWIQFIAFLTPNLNDGVAFQIHRLFHKFNVYVRCKICIKGSENATGDNIAKIYDGANLFQNKADWKIQTNWKLNNILKQREKFLPDGILNLFVQVDTCDGEYRTDITDTHFSLSRSNIKHLCSLRNDYKMLLQNPVHSDVTLKINDTEFPVHKAILSASSTVFHNMFQHDTTEKETGQVIIEDIQAEVVYSMICYIYFGQLNDLDFDHAFDLYYAANKYQISSLQQKCSNILKSSLSAVNVGMILVLGDAHSDQDLKVSAFDFVCTNAKKVLQSTDWRYTMQRRPDLSSEVLKAVLQFVAETSN